MKLFYRHYGEGKPLIILHGLLGLSDNWVTYARRLANRYSVYIPDQRNHGQSPHSPAFNYYSLVDDLHEFIQEHEIRQPVILGHSMGGKVAAMFALEYPEIARALMVVDISLRDYERRYYHINLIDIMRSMDLSAVQSRQEVEELLEQQIHEPRIRLFLLKNLYRRTRNDFAWRPDLASLSDNIDELMAGVPLGRSFSKPALFIRGGNSDYVRYKDYDDIYRSFPDASIKTIEGAGHWIHTDAPDEFFRVTSDFLEQAESKD